jgi:hypothetical protein
MKKIQQRFAIVCYILGTLFSLSSCYPTGVGNDPYYVDETRQKENFYYIPSAANTTFHAKKNDLNVNFMATSHTKFSGGELQASYIPGNHFGVIGSCSFANTGYSAYVKSTNFELGAGFITEFSKDLYFETYAGVGNGKVTNKHYTGMSKVNLPHFFIQPAIAIGNKNKNIQVGLVSKFVGVNFNVADTLFNTDRENLSGKQLRSLYDQPFHLMWEPGFVMRFGWKNFQFHTGYSFSTDLTDKDLYKATGNFSFGICLRLNTHVDPEPK